jgi:DNA-binding response OmpR family regulator
VSGQEERANVLIIDDEERVAETYKIRLRDEYDVDVATGGRQGLEMVDDEYDVVLLDRRMPDVSGDEVLDEIRERDLSCKVVMVTAVDPDFDLVDMDCTDYVVKPIENNELHDAIDRALRISAYGDRRQELGAKKLKRNVLEVEMHEEELAESEEYQTLEAEISDLEAEVDELEAELGIEEVDRYL